jgi:hypothetical protein
MVVTKPTVAVVLSAVEVKTIRLAQAGRREPWRPAWSTTTPADALIVKDLLRAG